MSVNDKFNRAFGLLPLIGILRGIRPEESVPVGSALCDLGWQIIEVPLNSPRPLASIEAMSAALPKAFVGAGTVLTVDDVRQVHAAGGQLVVSPNFNAAVVRETVRLGMISLPGVITPSEAFAALEAGASGLKLFPAEAAIPAVIKAVRAVLRPQVPLFAVGGINAANMGNYLAAGAAGFGIGGSLFKPGKPLAEIAADARAIVAAFKAARAA